MISRPVNVLIAFLSIFVAAVVTGSIRPLEKLLLACFSGALITIAANTINDYYDIEIDRINRPGRPLPAGMLTPAEAFRFSMICFGAGIILSLFIAPKAIAISVLFSVLLFLYSYYFKRTVLLGNFVVSLATAFAFIYGGLAVKRLQLALFPALFAFFMHFGREVIKDMEDSEGDSRNNAVTLPIRFGFGIAKAVATVLFLVLIVLTLVPAQLGIYGHWYLLTVLLGVNTVLIYTIISIWKNSSRRNLRVLSGLLKADMLVGLLAIYLGRF